MRYAAIIEKDGKALIAEFPDAPGCLTQADPGEHIERMAKEALEAWIESYLVTGEMVPLPSKRHYTDALWVDVRPVLALKVLLRNARLQRGWSQDELAKKVGVTQQAIAKIENPDKDIQLGTAERAAAALGFVVDPVLRRVG